MPITIQPGRPSTTAQRGTIELATTAETTTGTDEDRAVTPNALHDMTSVNGAAWFLDEDNMSSNSATKTASQQSIKAYSDALTAVGTAGGELGGTYPNPTVDSVHSGTAHHLASDAGPPNGTASGELGGTYPSPTVDSTHSGSAHHLASDAGPPNGTASGELGGTYPSPTIDSTHSGSAHHSAESDASTSVKGIVELATTTETATGTDTVRAVTPDGLHDMTTLSGAAWMLDEDDLTTNSDTLVATQQSIKAYSDALTAVGTAGGELNGTYPNPSVDATHGGSAHHAQLSQATQAALEAETNENTYAPPDLIKHSPGVAKVWCEWPSTTSITSSYNVASVTDTGVGNWTVVFDVDMSGTGYVVLVTFQDNGSAIFGVVTGVQTTGCSIVAQITDDTLTDPTTAVMMVAFGDQA